MPEHLETTSKARSEFFQSLTLATHLQCCHAQSCVADAQISNNGSFCQSELKGPIELFTGHGNLVHHTIAMYVIKINKKSYIHHLYHLRIVSPWLQFIHNFNWHMVRHVGSHRTNMNLKLAGAVSNCVGQNGTTNWWLATLATVAPLHLCCQIPSIFSHDKNGSHCLHKNIWDVHPPSGNVPLISLQNPKIISCRLMYSNVVIREWQQDFWHIAYNIAIFSVYNTSCVSPPTELHFTCRWSSYTWSGQLLRLK